MDILIQIDQKKLWHSSWMTLYMQTKEIFDKEKKKNNEIFNK